MSAEDNDWDAIVVGSGATGGVAAKHLAEHGLRVLVLEAGMPVDALGGYGNPFVNTAKQVFRRTVTRRQTVQSLHATYWTTNPNFFVDDVDNPYSTPNGAPFRWIRGRVIGGRTLVWDGVTPRMSDFELRARDQDGEGANWPIRYADLAPYYDRLESYLGVHGNADGLPQVPDGKFVAAKRLTRSERIFRRRVENEFPERRIIVSRGLAEGRTPRKGQTHSKLSNVSTTLEDAVKTGRTEIRSGAVVSRILMHANGTAARGVEYIDAATKTLHAVYGQLVFLCASTIETVRLLLNSATHDHPDGIGASSGILGRYLMDHIAGNLYFQLPDLEPSPGRHPLLGSDAIMVPRFQNVGRNDSDHLRGYGMWGGIDRINVPNVLRKVSGEAFGFLCTRGEVLPHFDNRVEIDPELKDAWGIPSVRIDCEWKENDIKVARAARLAAIEMIESAGGEIADITEWVTSPGGGRYLREMESEWKVSTPGLFVHEMGGARMGDSPRDSVVGPDCALWDVPNLFVTDGACWPSSGWQNPTLTEMAVTARAVDIAVESRR